MECPSLDTAFTARGIVTIARIALIAAAVLVLGIVGYFLFVVLIGNPWVERDLIEHPDGARAAPCC